jgi:hypothetical protein
MAAAACWRGARTQPANACCFARARRAGPKDAPCRSSVPRMRPVHSASPPPSSPHPPHTSATASAPRQRLISAAPRCPAPHSHSPARRRTPPPPPHASTPFLARPCAPSLCPSSPRAGAPASAPPASASSPVAPSRSLRHTEERPLHRCRAPVLLLLHCCLARPPHVARCPTARTRALVPATAAPASVPQICEASSQLRPLVAHCSERPARARLSGWLSVWQPLLRLRVPRRLARRAPTVLQRPLVLRLLACLLAASSPVRVPLFVSCASTATATGRRAHRRLRCLQLAAAAAAAAAPNAPQLTSSAPRRPQHGACRLPAARASLPLRYTPHRTPHTSPSRSSVYPQPPSSLSTPSRRPLSPSAPTRRRAASLRLV